MHYWKTGEQIGIDVTENSVSGRVDVTLQDGRPLSLAKTPASYRPQRLKAILTESLSLTLIATVLPRQLTKRALPKGRLAGLFKFRSEDLELAKNEAKPDRLYDGEPHERAAPFG